MWVEVELEAGGVVLPVRRHAQGLLLSWAVVTGQL